MNTLVNIKSLALALFLVIASGSCTVTTTKPDGTVVETKEIPSLVTEDPGNVFWGILIDFGIIEPIKIGFESGRKKSLPE